jgi:hypothetical protein
MKRLLLVPAVPAVALFGLAAPACESTGTCTPTTTKATEANKVDLTATSRSSTIEAKLTVKADGKALSGKSLGFAVLDNGAEVYTAEGTTQSSGVARIDLKRIELNALQAVARGDQFTATFSGDGTYCSSQDSAAFKVAKAPAGISVDVNP